MNRNKKLILGIVAGTSLAVGAGGVAYGAIPGTTDNSVTACITSQTGAVRIVDVDTGQTCLATEKKVTWGGGMRFMGVWKDGPGPGQVPTSWPRVNGYPDVKKGDVVRMEVPSNMFGCTTPKGAWVNVAGSYAYPCLEYPQNWAPLALDGATGAAGKNADVHWASFDASGKVVASSEPLAYTYSYSNYVLFQFPNLDLSKCGLQVSRNSATATDPGNVFVENYYGYVYSYLVNSAGSYGGRLGAVTVTATCVHY
jgi:hypothetical protein